MWYSEELLTTIAEFLDFQGLRLLCFASKESFKVLREKFLTQAHPHAVAYLARQIIQERIRAPRPDWYQMCIRDENLIRFADLDHQESGVLMLFSTELAENKESLTIQAAYAISEESFTRAEAFISVKITPSRENPMRSGTAIVTRQRDTTTVITTQYTEGFNPRLALEWCPVEMPNDMFE